MTAGQLMDALVDIALGTDVNVSVRHEQGCVIVTLYDGADNVYCAAFPLSGLTNEPDVRSLALSCVLLAKQDWRAAKLDKKDMS